MRTERLLQVTSALCVALGTILLGMGQRDSRMAVVAILGAMLSVWMTDILGIFRLNRWVASAIAFIASIIAFNDAIPLNSLSSIRAIAGLLVYLELILLFQKKNLRVYWQLLVLSLLQVIVSALFSQGAQFGLMIVIFMFVSLLDLALLNLFAEGLRASGRIPSSKKSSSAHNVDTSKPRVRIQVRRDLFRQVFRMGVATLALTLLIFFMLPRLGRPAWRSNFFNGPKSVGFNNRIELGQLGKAINDPTEVLRVKFTDPKDKTREPIKSEIYLHGTILTTYNNKNWYQTSSDPKTTAQHLLFFRSHHHYYEHSSRRRYGRHHRRSWYSFFQEINLYRHHYRQPQGGGEIHLTPESDKLPPNALRQDFEIEPMNHRELFGVRPYFSTELSPEISYAPQGERLLRNPSLCRTQFSYHLYTTGISHQNQLYYYPAEPNIDLRVLLEYPDNIPTVIKTAQEWVEESEIPKEKSFSRAMYIHKRLTDPKTFSYSLDSCRTDWNIDPVEDFIKNNPQGHCEYFATAFAMMLRSQGIPCRLVVGFKCDEYNPMGKCFRVRQLHAHSWVEVYFTAEDMSLDNISAAQFPHGLWYRFDPTPSASESTAETYKFLVPFAKMINWFDEAWDNYVMEMDRTRQNSAVYQPILNWFKATYQKITDPEWWIGIWKKVKPLLNPQNWNMEKWISWRGGLVGVAVMLTMLVVFRTTRWIYRIVARRIGKIRADKERRRRIEVEFYRRFLHVAARFGLTRSSGETPREFAYLSGPYIAKATENADLEPLPSLITEAYYQVRFGRSPLDNDRQKEIELAVSLLEAAAKSPNAFF